MKFIIMKIFIMKIFIIKIFIIKIFVIKKIIVKTIFARTMQCLQYLIERTNFCTRKLIYACAGAYACDRMPLREKNEKKIQLVPNIPLKDKYLGLHR